MSKLLSCVWLMLMLSGFGTAVSATNDEAYPEIRWEALVPKDWDPAKQFKTLDLSKLQDGDPKAAEALASMRSAWDAAPAEPSMNGRKVRIPGFVLPLDQAGEAVKSMLLVPYFGACIHTPPPPANQIVHVILKKPAEGMKMMDAFWVSGTLSLQRGDSSLGIYGYRMTGERLDPYGLPRGVK